MRLFATIVSRGVLGAWPEKTIMPSHLKSLVHARMKKTGETYQQALLHVRALEEREPTAASESESRAFTIADTAFSIAIVRAEEDQRPEGERLFRDPYATMFGGAGAHVAEATQRFLDLPFFRDGVRLRTRFIDDFVKQGIAAGVTQLVLLGAGFDSRGLRIPEIEAHGVLVFEVDTKHQLTRKRRVLDDAGVKLPSRIAYVPFEFEAPEFETRLASALEAKGFRRGAGALFVLEGVIGYIDNAASTEPSSSWPAPAARAAASRSRMAMAASSRTRRTPGCAAPASRRARSSAPTSSGAAICPATRTPMHGS